MLDEQGEWVGSSSELLYALEARVSDQVKRQRTWPSNGRSMTGHIKRLSPNLRTAGWQVDFHRESSRRVCSIHRQSTIASSDPLASSAALLPLVQIDATTCDHDHNDINDADDASAGATIAASERDDDGWEEGEL